MLQSIAKQLWNRKRGHVWVMLELLCVFCLIWYMVDFFFVYLYNTHIPDHRKAEHTWQVNLGMFPPGHPDYVAENDSSEMLYANYQRILQSLRTYPGVEAVSVASGGYSRLWSGSSDNTAYRSSTDTTLEVGGQRFTLCPDGDFFSVFSYTYEGKPVSMQDFDWSTPNALVVSRSVEEQLFPGQSAAGKEVINPWNTQERSRIIGVVDDVKRFDYLRPQHAYYTPYHVRADKMTVDRLKNMVFTVRSNASLSDAAFREGFKAEMENTLRIGNFYLLSVISNVTFKEDTARLFGITTDLRIRSYLMAFFLINIVLCVMGTFWYRVNTRRNEIGLRMAMGSTHKSIRSVFLIEGLVLLTVAAIPAMIIESQFVVADLIETMGKNSNMATVYLPDRTVLRFLITNAITWGILAIVIMGAIWLPASNASRIPPAEALHYE